MLLSRCVLLVLALSAGVAEAGKVRNALFSIFGTKDKNKPGHAPGQFDEDQLELLQWLKSNGFTQYATTEWVNQYDELADGDSIEDLCHLVEEEDYVELKIDKEEAMVIQKAARKTMLERFLKSVPLPPGAAPGVFDNLAEPLLAAGYEDPDDVSDIEEDECESLGIAKSHLSTLVTYAEEFEARELFKIVLTTYQDEKGEPNPFASETVWKPFVEALVKAGARTLEDLTTPPFLQVNGVSKAHMLILRSDARVLRHAAKQEL